MYVSPPLFECFLRPCLVNIKIDRVTQIGRYRPKSLQSHVRSGAFSRGISYKFPAITGANSRGSLVRGGQFEDLWEE